MTNFLFAQDNFLDTTFSTTGKIITSIDGSSNDLASSIAIQSDGKIIAVGNSIINSQQFFSTIRYNSDGSLDSTFGVNGVVITPFGSISDAASSVVVQNNGKILVGGSTYDNLTGNNFALVRYNVDGSQDLTFGTNGMVTTNFSDIDIITSLAVQDDGKIIAVGFSGATYVTRDFTIARYLENGNLDTVFNATGKVVLSLSPSIDFANTLVIQNDGKIIVAGVATGATDDDQNFAIVRFYSDGTLDTTFGVNGITITDFFGSVDNCNSIVLQNDGKILAAGSAWNGTENDFALALYTSSGALNESFGIDGKVTTDINSVDNICYSMILKDNKIILAGSTEESEAGVTDFALISYQMNGSLDYSFGNSGFITTNFNELSLSSEIIYSIIEQNDGKIVAVGNNFDGTKSNFALARYTNSLLQSNQIMSNSVLQLSVVNNPIEDTIIINSNSNLINAKVMIYDTFGKLVKEFHNFNGNYFIINRGNLIDGMYIVKIMDRDRCANAKILLRYK